MDGWIDPKERLPEQWEPVRCWTEYFGYRASRRRKGYALGYWTGERWGGEAGQGRDAKVLFWAPLPKPPRKRKKKKE